SVGRGNAQIDANDPTRILGLEALGGTFNRSNGRGELGMLITPINIAPDHPFKGKVFISYSRKDIGFTNRLEAALKARGFEVLIDRADIQAFEEWWARIEALIARADTVVFVLSPESAASDICRREIVFASSLNKRLAPIVWRRVDDKALPDALAQLNF